MRYFVLTATIMLLIAQCAESHAWGNYVEEPYDKISHAAVGTAITDASYNWLIKRGWGQTSAKLGALGVNATVWALKEVSDSRIDGNDFAAGVVGLRGITFTF